ncbi:conserved protein of unknown function [uncultured Woeseiaceae bacterium]|uniref:LmbE family protein n=1 Tax=uncultured Woeseiaceae bacterium TaxID=1983305 RepID=A0A7D9H5J4_9GAMM|nr:conserved protein of unknown function [uncultured Woeseiaceae bacterium]
MSFLKNKKILIVAAHPDDEVLGMGGTIAKAIDQGAKITVVFLGEGVSARFSIDEYESEEFKKQSSLRMEGAERALRLLGVEHYVFGSRLCTQFDQYSRLSIVKEVERYIDEFRPDMLFTHNPIEVNIDHVITYEVVECACRPVNINSPSEIYTFEIVCSGSWKFDTSFNPNVYVDVSDYFDSKLSAWHEYVGEDRPFPFPRSDTGLSTLAKYRGMASGLKMAEGFRLVRCIK